MTWVRARLCKLQKGCTRLASASDKVYQLLAQGRWFSPDTPASSTTKTGRHDIVAILLKVALSTNNHHPKSNNISSHYIINNIENLKIVTRFFFSNKQVQGSAQNNIRQTPFLNFANVIVLKIIM